MNNKQSKMNILFINSIGKNKWGGGEKWMLNIAKGLQDIGNKVTVASFKDSIISKEAQERELEFTPINYHTDFSFVSSVKIAKLIDDRQFDIVVCNLNRDVRVVGMAVRLSKKKPKLICRQGVQQIKNKWKYKVTFTKLADGILTNSNSLKNIYDSFGWWDENYVKVIYNGFKPSVKSEPFDYNKITTIKKDTKVILAAGRLDEQKGFEYFIEAAKFAKENNNDWKFFIAGKGKLQNKLLKLIEKYELQKYVFLLGFQSNLSSLFPKADIFVLSSLYEGMPNVLIEAMNSAKPVVSTPANGAAELVHNKENGLLIPFKDAKAIYEKIDYLLNNKSESNKLALAAQKHINDNFLFEDAVKKVNDYLICIISK